MIHESQVSKAHVDTHNVSHVFFHFPLENIQQRDFFQTFEVQNQETILLKQTSSAGPQTTAGLRAESSQT